MKLTSETKLFIGIFGFTACIIAIAMIIMTRPPKPVAKEVLLQNATHTTGPKDAAVWLVEFSDYQCPACSQFAPVVKKLTETYKDKLLFVYRSYPLPAHPMAIPAAYAAEAAALQGKYWEMHDKLFANQNILSADTFDALAGSLGLNMDTFTNDMKSEQIIKTIETDTALGNLIGINATPTFYLNGVKLNLLSTDDLIKAVEKIIQGK